MNKISDEIINNVVQQHYDYIISKYDEKKIFGVFTYGKVNYGFATQEQDIKTVFLYVPSFEEMCINPIKNNDQEEYINYKDTCIKKIDARTLYTKAIQQDKNIMEGLFSEYSIINPRYRKIFKNYIYTNRETIFHCNQKLRIKNAVNCGIESLEKYQIDKNINNLFNACRLRIACQLYLEGASCENCINLKKDYHIHYLWQILNQEITPNIQEIKQDLIDCLKESEELQENPSCEDLIKNGCIEIMKVAMTDMFQQKDFMNILTDVEKNALDIILDNLNDGYQGNISILQLTTSSGISRSVFKNLLQKMKDNLVAEIENQGTKGTYIKIIDGTLLQLK